MAVFIFLNGSASETEFYAGHFRRVHGANDTVVCADGGYALACALGVRPQYVIGDLDSIHEEAIECGVETIRYPAEKDFSDFELVLRSVERMGPDMVYVYGALGGRKDHEITNILLLARTPLPMVFIEKNVEVYNVATSLVLDGKRGFFCSLIALCGPCRVDAMEGFMYLLKNEVLLPSSRGLSNVITADRASIRVAEGRLIVFVNLS